MKKQELNNPMNSDVINNSQSLVADNPSVLQTGNKYDDKKSIIHDVQTSERKTTVKRSKFYISVSAVVVCIIAFSLRLFFNTSSDNVIQVGATASLTGIYADIGVGMMNGILLAQDILNEQNTNCRFSLIQENDKAEPKTAMSCIDRLLAHNVDALIIAGDNAVPVVAEKVRSTGKPCIATIVATSGFIQAVDGKPVNMFRNYASVAGSMDVLARYAYTKEGLRSITIFASQSPYGQDGMEAFKSTFAGLGGTIVSEERFNEDAVDVRNIITKGLAFKPEGVCVIGYGNGYNVLINQLREVGYDGLIFTDEPISGPSCKGVIKDFRKIIFTNNIAPDTPEYRAFVKMYRDKFNLEPNAFSFYGFDSMRILGEAFRAVGGKSSLVPKEILAKKNYETLFGKLVFLDNGDCVMPLNINKMNSDGTYDRLQ